MPLFYKVKKKPFSFPLQFSHYTQWIIIKSSYSFLITQEYDLYITESLKKEHFKCTAETCNIVLGPDLNLHKLTIHKVFMKPSTIVFSIVNSEILHPFLLSENYWHGWDCYDNSTGPLNRIAHKIIMNYDTIVIIRQAYRTEFFTIIIALQNYSHS